MTKRILLIALCAIMVLATGCKSKPSTEKMTPEEILQVLDIKISKNKNDATLYYDRAKILVDMHRYNEAISDLTNAIRLKDDKIEYYILMGDAQFANGNVDQSYKALQSALKLDEENQEANLKMGEIAFYSRDYDRAFESLTKVTAKDPNNRTALFMKGFVYKETGDTVSAITLFQKVCDLYPTYAPAFEELGILYADHKNKLALEFLTTAIELDPQSTSARYGLAMFYQDMGEMESAEETYKQLLDIDANDKDAWHNRGYIQAFFYGDYELAIEYYTKALQIDSQFIEAYVNRGAAYELNGDKANAQNDYKTALSLDPNYKPALEGLKRL